MADAAGILTFIGVLALILALRVDTVGGLFFWSIVAASCLSTAIIFAIP